jgi:hypothetical protein
MRPARFRLCGEHCTWPLLTSQADPTFFKNLLTPHHWKISEAETTRTFVHNSTRVQTVRSGRARTWGWHVSPGCLPRHPIHNLPPSCLKKVENTLAYIRPVKVDAMVLVTAACDFCLASKKFRVNIFKKSCAICSPNHVHFHWVERSK